MDDSSPPDLHSSHPSLHPSLHSPLPRLYRSTSHRSSRRSSRRSSLSSASLHSHSHSHSFRAHDHIAQHLRRASIIETRKARLADRAAHAEQVRLRAALAKTPRMINTEERAVAAAKAREKYLAKVAATCAEEVKRAKRVAEENKEKREALERRQRGDMQERMADAERRRTEYQKGLKRGRASSGPRTPSQTRTPLAPTPADAATRIQNTWKIHRRKRIVRAFLDLRLSVPRLQSMEFGDVGALLSQPDVLLKTARLLEVCALRDRDSPDTEPTSTTRTFLSAFLIAAFPDQVLSGEGEQEQDLMNKSVELITAFDRALPSLSHSRLQSFAESYHTFCAAFSAWKAHDSSVLVQTMVAQYVELDSIWQRVRQETERVVHDEYREGIRENQVLLFVRIKRLAGPERAKELIRDAVNKSRRRRNRSQARDAARDVNARPRQTQESSTGGSRGQIPSILPDPGPPASGAQFGKVASLLPSNRVLVHELALNKEYRIDADMLARDPSRLAGRQAVFSAMRDSLSRDDDSTEWTVAMAMWVRERLERLVSKQHHLHTLIRDVFDVDVIRRECSMGSFSYDRLFQFLLSILPKLCAPFRDAQAAQLAHDQSGDAIDRLSRFVDFLDLMSVDFASFLLQQAAPRLIEEAPGYEERMFADDMARGEVSLGTVGQWWEQAREKVMAESARRDPEGVGHPANQPTWRRIYAQGLVDLVFDRPDAGVYPATLELDRKLLTQLRIRVHAVVVVSGVLLTAKTLLKRDVRSHWDGEAQRLWEMYSHPSGVGSGPAISPHPGHDHATSRPDHATSPPDHATSPPDHATSPPDPAAIVGAIESSHALPPATKRSLLSFTSRLLSTAGGETYADPVPRLLLHRLRTHVLARVGATSANERVRLASLASDQLVRNGMPEFVNRVGEITSSLERVAELDRQAHARWLPQSTFAA